MEKDFAVKGYTGDAVIARGYAAYDEWRAKKLSSRNIVTCVMRAVSAIEQKKAKTASIEALACLFALDMRIKEKYSTLLHRLFLYFPWRREARALRLLKGAFHISDNIKDVHAYGVELKADSNVALSSEWQLGLNATLSWTPSINEGEPRTPADQSVGKQLPYVPEYSSTVTGRLSWRSWGILYKWCYYSERFTMSSNDISLAGKLPKYYMSNLTLEKNLSLRWADLSLKGAVNNLFNEEYLSVLSRPMPGINFEFFLGITPKWSKR